MKTLKLTFTTLFLSVTFTCALQCDEHPHPQQVKPKLTAIEARQEFIRQHPQLSEECIPLSVQDTPLDQTRFPFSEQDTATARYLFQNYDQNEKQKNFLYSGHYEPLFQLIRKTLNLLYIGESSSKEKMEIFSKLKSGKTDSSFNYKVFRSIGFIATLSPSLQLDAICPRTRIIWEGSIERFKKFYESFSSYLFRSKENDPLEILSLDIFADFSSLYRQQCACFLTVLMAPEILLNLKYFIIQQWFNELSKIFTPYKFLSRCITFNNTTIKTVGQYSKGKITQQTLDETCLINILGALRDALNHHRSKHRLSERTAQSIIDNLYLYLREIAYKKELTDSSMIIFEQSTRLNCHVHIFFSPETKWSESPLSIYEVVAQEWDFVLSMYFNGYKKLLELLQAETQPAPLLKKAAQGAAADCDTDTDKELLALFDAPKKSKKKKKKKEITPPKPTSHASAAALNPEEETESTLKEKISDPKIESESNESQKQEDVFDGEDWTVVTADHPKPHVPEPVSIHVPSHPDLPQEKAEKKKKKRVKKKKAKATPTLTCETALSEPAEVEKDEGGEEKELTVSPKGTVLIPERMISTAPLEIHFGAADPKLEPVLAPVLAPAFEPAFSPTSEMRETSPLFPSPLMIPFYNVMNPAIPYGIAMTPPFLLPMPPFLSPQRSFPPSPGLRCMHTNFTQTIMAPPMYSCTNCHLLCDEVTFRRYNSTLQQTHPVEP